MGDVRGLGPMLVIELVRDPVSKAPSVDETVAVTAETLRRGVIAIRAGLFSNCVRFLPPLTITSAQLDEAMEQVAAAVASVAAARDGNGGSR